MAITNELLELETRRDALFIFFCLKVHSNPRFKDLKKRLQERTFTAPNLRPQQIIKEAYARTDRINKSPLFTIRRTLNDIVLVT